MIFTKALKHTIQIKNQKCYFFLMIMIAKLNTIVTELFIRVNSIFNRLNSTHYFVMEILNKRELQQTAFNHS